MAIQFNIDEIFEMAEQIERNGAKFYRKAAAGFQDPEAKQLLIDLADAEVEHEKTFADMRKDLTPKDRTEMVFDPDGEAALYLQAFADGYVFDVKKDPSDSLTGQETIARVLRIAIELEKDSIIFYMGMKNIVPAHLGKEKMDGIIAQEMSHITILAKHLDAAKSK